MRYIGRDNVKKLLEGLAIEESIYEGGEACFLTSAELVVVRPQYPLEHQGRYEGYYPAPLVEVLERRRLVAVLLVRLGGYAVGVYDGEQLVASKVGVRFVKNRNKKGGSSSNRFRRRREEQAKALVEEAAAVAEQVLGEQLKAVEALALGGDKEAVRLALAESRVLTAAAAEKGLQRFFTTEDPRQRVLEALPYDLYAAVVERRPLRAGVEDES